MKKLGYSFKKVYRRIAKKEDPKVLIRRAYLCHSIFCFYNHNDYIMIHYDETGLNSDAS